MDLQPSAQSEGSLRSTAGCSNLQSNYSLDISLQTQANYEYTQYVVHTILYGDVASQYQIAQGFSFGAKFKPTYKCGISFLVSTFWALFVFQMLLIVLECSLIFVNSRSGKGTHMEWADWGRNLVDILCCCGRLSKRTYQQMVKEREDNIVYSFDEDEEWREQQEKEGKLVHVPSDYYTNKAKHKRRLESCMGTFIAPKKAFPIILKSRTYRLKDPRPVSIRYLHGELDDAILKSKEFTTFQQLLRDTFLEQFGSVLPGELTNMDFTSKENQKVDQQLIPEKFEE